MDRHSTLYDSLNDSCKKSKLKSWTRHVNQKGTVYTIRFDETSAILDQSDPDNSYQRNTIIYKPKSQYHVNRDFVRMRGFKNYSSIANPVHNSTVDDISYISDFYHSKPEPNVNTQLASQAECISPTTQESVSHSNASSHAMPHKSPTNFASVEKVVHYASEFRIPPPVEYESTDTFLPLVQFEATESMQTQNNDELYHACCISPPCLKPPVEQISLLSELISEPRNDSSYTDSPYCDSSYNPVSDFDFSFDPNNSQCILEKDFDSHPTHTNDCSPPQVLLQTHLSNSDVLCNSCSATAPHGTKMLYCDKCSLHICGNCMHSYPHSVYCDGKLRYMNDSERHLRYVPDSKNNSTISDCSRPPELSHDQQVPQIQSDDAADFIRSLLNESKARFKEDIHNAVCDSMDSFYNKDHSTSSRFGK